MFYKTEEQITNDMIVEKCDSTHKKCRDLKSNILKLIDKNVVFTQDFINKYIDFLTKNYFSNWKSLCIQNCYNYEDALHSLILLNIIPDDAHILILINYKRFDDIKLLLDNKLFTVTVEHIKMSLSCRHLDMTTLLLQHCNLNNEILNECCINGSMSNVNYILENKIIPNDENLITVIRVRRDEIIDMFLSMGCLLTNNVFREACKQNNIKIIKECFDNKIVPTTDNFDDLFKLCHVYQNRERLNNTRNSIITDIIDIFIYNGYQLTYDNLLKATSCSIVINNIEQFQFKLDNRFYDLCFDYNFYPSYYDQQNNLNILIKECKRAGNLTNIRKIILKDKISPNQECLENACLVKNNHSVIKFLIETCNLKPNNKCLQNIMLLNTSKPLTYFINSYINCHPETLIDEKNNDVKDDNVKNDNVKDDNVKDNDVKDDDSFELGDEPIKQIKIRVKKQNNNKE